MREIVKIFIAICLLLFCNCIIKAEQSPTATLDTVVLQLKWKHQFQFAGYYAALEKGYYENAGLYVKIIEAGNGEEVIPSVVAGRAEFGIATSDLLLIRNSGFPVVLLANIFQHSPHVFLTLQHNDGDNIHDISGKSIMLEKHADELLAYLKTENINTDNIDFRPHTFSPDDLINNEVFAISAYITDEPFILVEQGISYNIFNPRSSGIDFYGDVLFTSEYENEVHPERVKRFLDASLKGWQYALDNEEEIVDLILSKYSKRHSKQHLLYEANQTKRLIMPDVVEIGYINKNRWQRIGEIYSELNMLPPEFSLDGFIYDRNTDPDLKSLYFTIIVSVLALFLISFIALRFYKLNNRLKSESAEKQLREDELIILEERYRNLAKYVPVPIFITSPVTGDILYINKMASEKFEINEEYAISKKAVDLYVNPVDREKTINKINNQGYVRESEVLMKSAGGSEFWAIISSNIIVFDSIPAIFSAVIDISEVKLLHEKLENANSYKDKLFSIISHDLKGPVGTLNSFLNVVVNKEHDISSEKQFEILSKLRDSSNTTYELLENLLLWSLKQKDKIVFNPVSSSLYEIVELNIKLFENRCKKKIISVINECPVDAKYYFDYDMINIVIRNLISNAIKFSNPNSEINLMVYSSDIDFTFSITDHGIGIEKIKIKSIFDFKNNRDNTTGTEGEKGTGLGLILCRDLINEHGGKLWVESELGHGSTFYFTIPIVK